MVLAIRNNNPGNLRPVGASDGFQGFATPEEGLNAMRDDLRVKVTGRSKAMAGKFGEGYQPTLANVINTWAPPTENDTKNYVDFVAKNSGLSPDSILTEQDVEKIMPAMIKMEGGQEAADYFLKGSQGEDQLDNLVDIEMPDGTVIEGVPADMSKAQILERLKANGIDTSTFEQTVEPQEPQPPAAVEQTPTEQPDDFFSRVGRDLNRRGGIATEIDAAQANGEQGALESLFQDAGNVVGGGLDILGQGVYSGMRGLSNITPDAVEEPLKAAGGEALKLIGKLPTIDGSTLGESIPGEVQALSEGYGKFAEANPRAARNLGALGNFAQVVPVGKAGGLAAKGAVKTAGTVGEVTKKASKMMKSSPSKKGLMTSDQVKTQASKFYKAADEAGGMINEDKAFDMFDRMAKEVLPNDPKDLKAVSKETYVRTLEDLQDAYLGSPLSLENLVNIDQRLTAEAQKLVTSDPNARRLVKNMQSVVRETMEQASPDDIVGGEVGFKMYKEGTKLYAKSKRMEEIEKIIRVAKEKEQPSTAIKNKLISLRENKKLYKGFSDLEKKAIDKAIKTGAFEGLLRTFGSRLPAVGALSSGAFLGPMAIPAAAAVYGGSALSRMGANGLRMRKANKILRQIQPDTLQSPEALKQLYKTR